MQLRSLWLTDFRNYTQAELSLAPGLTAVVGANGEGKTNLLEAIGVPRDLRLVPVAPDRRAGAAGRDRGGGARRRHPRRP